MGLIHILQGYNIDNMGLKLKGQKNCMKGLSSTLALYPGSSGAIQAPAGRGGGYEVTFTPVPKPFRGIPSGAAQYMHFQPMKGRATEVPSLEKWGWYNRYIIYIYFCQLVIAARLYLDCMKMYCPMGTLYPDLTNTFFTTISLAHD